MSELFIADAFVQRSNKAWRYVKEWDAWFEWQADGWHEDKCGKVRGYVADLIRESMNWSHASVLTEAQKRSLCSNKSASGIIQLAGAHPDVSVSADLWDLDPMTLGVPGGVVDLRTGYERAAEPEDYITRRTAVAPVLGPPRLWLRHLKRVLVGEDRIKFFQAFLGYVLTGEIGEHAMLLLFGHGANGKSVIVDTLIRILGDYGYSAPVELLMETKQRGHPVELAMLRGRRLVSCTEPPQGSRWDDGRIRSLTGDGAITARKMGENLSTFASTHKLIVTANHKPTLRSVDEAIRRRFNILDFGVTIPVEERDPLFQEKLRGEWPQILNWMIDGCLLWQENGLSRPDSMVEATEEYLQDEDSFGAFLTECCEREPDAFCSVGEAFRAYSSWAERVGERAIGRKSFKSALLDTPGVSRRKGAVPESVDGVRLKAAARPESVAGRVWLPDD